jgi:hypothetical protein
MVEQADATLHMREHAASWFVFEFAKRVRPFGARHLKKNTPEVKHLSNNYLSQDHACDASMKGCTPPIQSIPAHVRPQYVLEQNWHAAELGETVGLMACHIPS